MVEIGILNADIADVLSHLGHMDEVIICDAGFPIPQGVRTIDVAIAQNKPMVRELLEEILKYFSVEKIIFADETKKVSPSYFDNTVSMFEKGTEVETMPHTEFKKRARSVKAVIRTGDFTSYANILLVSGSGKRWFAERP
jgi:D-ribose pyranase